MRNFLLLSASMFCICCSSANSTPSNIKGLYDVFPKSNTEIAKTSDFLKTTLDTNDILPNIIEEQLASWTVEATPDEAMLLEPYPDIDRVVQSITAEQPMQSSATTASSQAVRDIVESTTERFWNRDVSGTYGIIPYDGKDFTAINNTQMNLQKIIGGDNLRPPFIYRDEVKYWVAYNITNSLRDQVAKEPGVESILPADVYTGSSVLPPSTSPAAKLSKAKMKRAMGYSTQADAVSELVAISQPSTIPQLKELKNYVYEANSGKQSYVYHLECGVSYLYQADEFPNLVDPSEHLQTDEAKIRNLQPFMDLGLVPDSPSHSTCTASKAVSKTYGAAKQAKLIVVQMPFLDGFQINDALRKIMADVSSKPDRQRRSVVTMSLGKPFDPNNQFQVTLKSLIQDLMDMDIPMFVPAGNNAAISPKVDDAPAIWASDDYPLLSIGSTNFAGERSSISQVGDQVFLYAPGEDITGVPRNSHSPSTGNLGTSFACPLVAGQVANLLSYDQVPFDTSNGHLVKNLRDYLKTDAASWSRGKDADGNDVRMIWNGVTEKDNPKPQVQTGPPPPPSPSLTCNGISNAKWMSGDAIGTKISGFCADAAIQGVQDRNSGSISRSYDSGNGNDLSLSIDWPSDFAFRPSETDCTNYIKQVVDNCDGNDLKNPMDWKHGGSMQVGQVKYNVLPNFPKYIPGICSMHVHEYQTWDGVPSDRKNKFQVTVDTKDGSGNVLPGSNGDQWASDSVPYVLNVYYDSLIFTPEAQGGDYIQFQLGAQHWTTDEPSDTAKCTVGGWNKDTKPIHRDMDCTFQC